MLGGYVIIFCTQHTPNMGEYIPKDLVYAVFRPHVLVCFAWVNWRQYP